VEIISICLTNCFLRVQAIASLVIMVPLCMNYGMELMRRTPQSLRVEPYCSTAVTAEVKYQIITFCIRGQAIRTKKITRALKIQILALLLLQKICAKIVFFTHLYTCFMCDSYFQFWHHSRLYHFCYI